MTTTSDTTRTDALADQWTEAVLDEDNVVNPAKRVNVWDFARQLERELSAAKADAERLKLELEECRRNR